MEKDPISIYSKAQIEFQKAVQYAQNNPRNFATLVGILLFVAISVVAMQRHHKRDVFFYRGELWADKGGYYIYLPAFFIYDFDAESFPPGIVKALGKGFRFDNPPGKLYTRYTSGVAILQAPFFLIAHALAGPLGYKPSGFSVIYHKMINVASAFYSAMALLLLFGMLSKYHPRRVALITILLIYLGTNLFHYSVDETGMSHVYSFFLFSVFMFFLQQHFSLKEHQKWHIWVLAFTSAMVVLIRPTNVVFLGSAWFFLEVNSLKDMKVRLQQAVKPRTMAVFFVATAIVFFPQLCYWKYLSGNYIYYSYEQAGFKYWTNPKFLEVWFETMNGLFTYTPMAFFFLVGMIYMILQRNWWGWVSLFVFLLMSYSFASWEFWHFGCSFGQRSFVEFYALFSLPFATFIEKNSQFLRPVLSWSVALLCAIFVYVNLRFAFFWKECWHWGHWDWAKYFEIVGSFFGF